MRFMTSDTISEVMSSKTNLRIAALVSIRPRALSELAELVGVSIQAVLKHLKRLERLGIVQKEKIAGGGVSVRYVYAAKDYLVGDFSTGDLTIVKLSSRAREKVSPKDPLSHLEFLAEEAIVQRRRIREEARKLGRLIGDLVDDEVRLDRTIDSMGLQAGERLILHALYTADSIDEGQKVLSKHYGLRDGRRSIDRVLAKAGSIAKK